MSPLLLVTASIQRANGTLQSITELRSLVPCLNYHPALNGRAKGAPGTEQNTGLPAATSAFTVSLRQGPEVKSRAPRSRRKDGYYCVEGNYRQTEEIMKVWEVSKPTLGWLATQQITCKSPGSARQQALHRSLFFLPSNQFGRFNRLQNKPAEIKERSAQQRV